MTDNIRDFYKTEIEYLQASRHELHELRVRTNDIETIAKLEIAIANLKIEIVRLEVRIHELED